MQLLSKTNIHFLNYSKYSFMISTFIIIIGFIYCVTQGVNKSIDFSGGTIVNISVDKKHYDINFLRSYLSKTMDENIKVVEESFNGQDYKIILTMNFLEDEKKLASVLDLEYKDYYSINMIESIGPKIGNELQNNAIKAIVTAMIFIGLYISFRFDGFYALGSLIALMHDVAITFTGLMLLQYEISITIIAALLTIVGYSLNDTIVIYDRIRENLKINTKVDREIIINSSLNITLNRTIITSVTTLIVAFVLLIVGGNTLQPFSMALIIGVFTGTYSSLFIATPIMVALEKKYKLEDLEEEE